MNKEPETYEELIRFKRCVDLTQHYELSQEILEKIYNFLASNKNAKIEGNSHGLILCDDTNPQLKPEIINAKCINSGIDGLTFSNSNFSIIPHYEPSRSSGYSGGSSSNNNNNNNNNNR